MIDSIIAILDNMYADAQCTLEYTTPLQLLIATQLAAQCTDARVNIITKELFKKYKNVGDFANAHQAELEVCIKSAGFYHNKAKNIIACCNNLINNFNGQVPDNLEDLLTLEGVGRKTANLILGDIFGISGIVVDTHATRLSYRWGLTRSRNPVQIEKDLMAIIPYNHWSKFCHQLVYFGREVCTARSPKCEVCPILSYCWYKA